MRTLHPSVQFEESRQARKPANEGATVGLLQLMLLLHGLQHHAIVLHYFW